MALNDARFSRNGTISPLGTLTEDAKTKIDFDTMQAFRVLVREVDMDVSGALRDWIYLKVHGETYTAMVSHAAKIKAAALFGEGPIEGIKKVAP